MICLAKVEEIVLPPVTETHHPWVRNVVMAVLAAGILIASAELVLMALRARRKDPRDL